ncbi:MAG TPA: hypothetical protein DDZ53_03240 [Firmicutes bacterium]|jgi:broad specificity phosphatase PhoE|nr:hypothetical protein [Bacillota bacterium]
MSSKLYVVHHSKPIEASALHPSQLPLSREGIMLVTPVAEASFWSSVAVIYYSPELKAAQTADIIAHRWQIPLYMEEDLSDMWIVRGGLPQELFERIVGDHLEGLVSHPLLEDYVQAQQRIVRCVRNIASKHTGSFAIVSHARILTAFYSHLLGRRLGRQEWLSIRTPDLSVIDLDTWHVTAGFFGKLS